MSFLKWSSIENHYQEKNLERWVWSNPKLDFSIYEVTEKIHGANFSILISGDQVTFCRRTGPIPEVGESFYGYREVMQRSEIAEMIKYLKVLSSENSTEVQLYGELFGSNIQKGVYYGPEKNFRWFSLRIGDHLLSPKNAEEKLRKFLNLKVPVIDRIKAQGFFSLIESINPEFTSLLTPEGYNEPNICEGIVITPFEDFYPDSIFLVKKKNKAFEEAKQVSKRSKSTTVVSSVLQEAFDISEGYVTDMRTQSVFSKLGPLEEMNQIGTYAKFYINDVLTDLDKDHPFLFSTLEKKEISLVHKKLSQLIFQILKKSM